MPKKQLHNLPGTCQRLARRLAEGCMRVEIVMMQAPPPLPEREAEATEDELGEQSFFLHLKDTSLFQTKIWQTTQPNRSWAEWKPPSLSGLLRCTKNGFQAVTGVTSRS